MRIQFLSLIFLSLMTIQVAWPQRPQVPAAINHQVTASNPSYRVNITIEQRLAKGAHALLNGKQIHGQQVINSRSYEMTLNANSLVGIKVGNSTVFTGSSPQGMPSQVVNVPTRDIFVGIEIDCVLRANRIHMNANINSLSPASGADMPEGSMPNENQMLGPLVRQIHAAGVTTLQLNRRILMAKVSDVSSKMVYYFYMTVTQI